MERPTDLTVEWLAAALGAPVRDFAFERIGTGQMSECYPGGVPCAEGESGPTSVVLRPPPPARVSRQPARAPALNERKGGFSPDAAPALGGPTPPCPHAAYDA